MSAARHPQIDGLIERVDEIMQIALRCYSSGSAYWLGISFTHGWFLLQFFNQWNFDTFEVSYEYLPADWLIDCGPWYNQPSLPTISFDLASVCNVVQELLTVSKQCLASRSFRIALPFVLGELAFLSSKVYIFTCVINVLVHLPLLKKGAWNCTRLTSSRMQPSFYLYRNLLSKAPNLDIEIN